MIEQRAAEIAGKVAGVTEKVSYAASGSTVGMGAAKVFCGMLLSDWALIVGIVTATATAIVSIYCKLAHLKLAKKRKSFEATNDDD